MFFLAAALLVGACASAPQAAPTKGTGKCLPGKLANRSEAGMDLSGLCIQSARKTHAFQVEVAATSEQQMHGLMFRTELADNNGMIFPFPSDRIASFWMRNTPIPLDIIFIRKDGTIESIAAMTTPYSLNPVSSGGMVRSVLEVRGGLCAELGIKPGDKINWL